MAAGNIIHVQWKMAKSILITLVHFYRVNINFVGASGNGKRKRKSWKMVMVVRNKTALTSMELYLTMYNKC